MRIVFLGPPGAGKGTQSAILSKRFNTPVIATGDIFRKDVSARTKLGEIVGPILARGDLVPDEITIRVVRERLNLDDAQEGFILDGYPRTVAQAFALEETLSSAGTKLDQVIKFSITPEAMIGRLAGRRVCPNCERVYHIVTNPPRRHSLCNFDNEPLIQRDDDKEETILHRLEVFEELTQPLFEFYVGRGILFEVDAGLSPNEVTDRISAALT